MSRYYLSMWHYIQRYLNGVLQWFVATDDQPNQQTPLLSSGQKFFAILCFVFLIPLDLILRGIFYNFFLSCVSGFIDLWNLCEIDDKEKIAEISNRPILGRLIGSIFLPVGWLSSLVGLNIINSLTFFESIYLNMLRGYEHELSSEQETRLNKLFKPKTAMGYLLGWFPGMLTGAMLLNIKVLLNGFIRGWNDAWYDDKSMRLQKIKSRVWWNVPGKLLSWLPRLLVVSLILPLRIVVQSTVGFYDGLFSKKDEPWLTQENKLGLIGKVIGKLIAKVVLNSIELFTWVIHFTHRLNFADHYDNVSPKTLPFSWYALPGLLLALPLAMLQSIVTFSARVVVQLCKTWANYLILSYFEARQYSLSDEELDIKKVYQIKQSQFEKNLGLISWILTFGWLFYRITYFISLVFIVFVETTIRMFYYSFIYLLELAFWDQKVSLGDYPTLAKRDFFGVIGTWLGFIIGTGFAILITIVRFLFESCRGVVIGLCGLPLDDSSNALTEYQIGLSAIGYAMGRLIRANFLLPFDWIRHVYSFIYFDANPSKIPQNLFKTNLSKNDYMMAFITWVPAASMTAGVAILLGVWRVINESISSFKDALPYGFKGSLFYDNYRTKTAQYAFGFPGIILAYIPSLVMIAFAPLVALYKWIRMQLGSRYDDYKGNSERLETIKKLFSGLNNLSRTFDEDSPLPENSNGGKGSYCFIGKILCFNQSSIAEVYMDEVLEQQKSKPETIALDDTLKQRVKDKFLFWNDADEAQLNKTHEFVASKYI